VTERSIPQGNPMPDELSNDVARHFERVWQNYDQQIRRTIPFYDDALELLVAVVARTDTTPHRILDLGVGTGNLAGLLLGAFPDAHLTGIDIVPDFLEIAQHRLARFRDRVQLIEADIAGYDFPAGVDIVVTSFVLHHTEDVTKGRTYERIYSSLNSGGCMANADFVDSASPTFSRVFDELRVRYMRQRGVSEERIHVEYASGSWLERLANQAPHALRDKPVLLVWGMKDRAFGSPKVIERWQQHFPAAEVVALADANHFIQEDAPDPIADAVAKRFGPAPPSAP
jgi:tRNA (cmo5U34)-methyltransferase